MDISGFVWLVMAILIFPFGYKPLVALLSFSSIFQASKMITLSGTDYPLFFCIEIILLIRLFIPYKNSGLIKLNSKVILFIFLFILILWFHAYFMTFIFDKLKVFSSLSGSNELSVSTGGVILKFSSANLNQLVLFTTHLLLAAFIYARRKYIDNIFYLKTIIFSVIFLFVLSVIWKFNISLYSIISLFFFNSSTYSIASIYDSRFFGTFTEPSLAGLFIGSLFVPFLFSDNNRIKLTGIFLLILSVLNISSTLVFCIAVSSVLVFLKINKRLDLKIVIYMFGFVLFCLSYYFLQDYTSSYIYDKSISESGKIRSAVNYHAIENIFNSYFLGIGLGSERASSSIIALINNLGIFLSSFLIYIIYKLINTDNNNTQNLLRLCLLVCIFGSFSSIQELTVPIIWNLIFANISSSRNNT